MAYQEAKEGHWLLNQLRRGIKGYGKAKKVYGRYGPRGQVRTRQMAYRAWKGVQRLERMKEQKYYDLYSTMNPSSSGAIVSMNAIAHGDDTNDREGDKIMVHSINLKYVIDAHASSSATLVRILIVYDTKCVAGTIPAVSDILGTVSTYSHLKGANRNRFIPLFDKTYKLCTPDSANGYGDMISSGVVGKFFNKQSRPVRFSGSGAADEGSHHLWMVGVSNEATNTPAINFSLRVRYTDT